MEFVLVAVWLLAILAYYVYSLRLETEARYMEYTTHQDTGFWLYLQPSIEIPDGGEVNLPIEVFESAVTLNGNYGYKVVSISSPIKDDWYGEGEEINITVTFTDTVYVTGTPKLLLNTGCHDDDCQTYEVQSFLCAADTGAFAITFNEETVPNIHVNSSQEQLKYLLESLDSITRVAVAYSYADNAEMTPELSRRRACTTFGNTVTVTFMDAEVKGTDGDLPEMTMDSTNELIDTQTGHSVGDGTFLVHGTAVSLDEEATEETKGVMYEDREAYYIAGSGTDTLIFQYIVQVGDTSADLDYVDGSSLYCDDDVDADDCDIMGSNGVAVNYTLPTPGDDTNYRFGTGSSLGANKDIEINTDPPVVVEVTTPMPDGSYGLTDVLWIDVVFDQPVAVSGSPTLTLETGISDATAEYYSYFNHTVRFKYTVGSLHSTGDLEYKSNDALEIDDDGWIRRDSTTPTTNVNTTLPDTYSSGSLGYTHKLVIYDTGPRIVDITSDKPDGTYTTGEVFNISVTFGFTIEDAVEMYLSGTPAIYVETGIAVMFQVRSATNGSEVIEFTEGHGLESSNSSTDIGLQFRIHGRIYTVASIDENLITMEEVYIGDNVVAGVPETNISTPGFRKATYVEGANTTTLVFQYMALPGDKTDDLELYGTEMELEDGKLHRLAQFSTADADLTLMTNYTCATPIYGCSLGGNKDLAVNSKTAVVTKLTSTKPSELGPYGVRDSIDVSVHFSLNVSTDPDASNTPRLLVDTYGYAEFYSGSESRKLTFIYNVRSGDISPDFDAFNVSDIGLLSPLTIVYSGITGYIRRTSTYPTSDASLFVPVPGTDGSLSYTYDIVIDTSAPYIVHLISDLPDDTYGAGQEIPIICEFSEPVNVTPNATEGGWLPYFILETGTVDRVAQYYNGSGTVNITFLYTVTDGDHTDDLDVKQIQNDLTSTTVIYRNGSEIKSLEGQDAVLTLPYGTDDEDSLSTHADLDINTTAPSVVNVTTTTPDGTYSVGQEILIYIEFSFPVVVTGAPNLALELGVNDVVLNFTGYGSDDHTTLLFTYIVDEDQFNGDLDYDGQSALTLPGNATIKRESTHPITDASVILPKNGGRGSLGFNHEIQIDTSVPTVEYVSSSYPAGSYAKATTLQTIDIYGSDTLTAGSFTLTYSEFTTPCIPVVDLNASYLEESIENMTLASSALNVSVTRLEPPYLYATRFSVEFVEPSTAIKLLEANIDGCDTFLCGGSPCASNSRGVEVNRDIPTIQNGTIEILVGLSADVVVNTTSGKPQLYLDVDGGNTTYAEYGPARSQIINVGLNVDDDITDGQFKLKYGSSSTGCIEYNIASSSVKTSALKNRLLEVEEIAVLGLDSVTVTQSGFGYIFNVTFAQGIPKLLSVETNDTLLSDCTDFSPSDVEIEIYEYTQELHFHYTIDEDAFSRDLDYLSTNALKLAGSRILRYSTNPTQLPDLTLPSPGESGSLSHSSSLKIDGRDNPRITKLSSSMYGDTYTVGDQLNLTLTFDQQLDVNTTEGTPYFLLNIGDSPQQIWYSSGTNKTMSFEYEILSGDDTTDLEYYSSTSLTLNDGSVVSSQSLASVVADMTLPPKNDSFSYDGGALVIDTTAPFITGVYTFKENGSYGVGEQIMIHIDFSAAVEVSGTPELEMNSGGIAYYAGLKTTIQEFDIGFRTTQNITAGEFQVQYDAYATSCIPFYSQATFESELRSLSALEAFSVNVSLQMYQGGYRYQVELGGGDDAYGSYPQEMDVPTALSTSCEEFSPSSIEVTNSPRSTISFNYVVHDGDSAEDLDIAGTDALSGGSILRWSRDSTIEANLTLPAKGLVPAASISVNDTVPVVQNVTSIPSNGTLFFQDALDIYVLFSLPVAIGGDEDPVLVLNNGFTASYESGSYMETLKFRYEVGGEGESVSLLEISSITTEGWLRRASSSPNTDVDLTLPTAGSAGSLSFNSGIKISSDRVTTYVVQVYSPHPDGTFTVGEEIMIVVEFYRAINYTGPAPQLAMEVGTGEDYLLDSISPPVNHTTTLNFSYVIQSGHSNEDLSYAGTNALTILNDTQLTDVDGQDVDLTLPTPGSSGSLSDSSDIAALTEAPTILYVDSGSPDEVYVAGDVVNISIHFHVPVVVYQGVPALALKTGDVITDGRAIYSSGSGTDTLWFEYIVRENDQTWDLNYDGIGALQYPTIMENNAMIIADYEDIIVEANYVLPAMDSGNTLKDYRDISLDTTRPTVDYVYTDHEDGKFGVGEVIDVTVVFSAPVAVQGLVSLEMETGDTDYEAPYLSGSGTTHIVFRYTIQEEHTSSPLDYTDTRSTKSRVPYTRPLNIEVGTSYVRAFSQSPTTDALLFLPLPGTSKSLSGTSNITVDSTVPTVYMVTCHNDNAVYGAGRAINISVTFTFPVTLIDTAPSLQLETGTFDRYAEWYQGNNSNTLWLLYTVERGDYTELLDYKGTDSLVLYQGWRDAMTFEGSLKRMATIPTQDVDLTLPPPGDALTVVGPYSIIGSGTLIAIQTGYFKAIEADSETADGTYGVGQEIVIEIYFSVAVTVGSPKPMLALGLDNRIAYCNYTGGTGTDVLTFFYLVEDGDSTSDLDYVSSDAGIWALFGSLATASAGAILDDSLPSPGNPKSLSANRDIAIDTNPPYVEQVLTDHTSGEYGAGEVINIYVHFNYEVIMDSETAYLTLDVLGSDDGYVVEYDGAEPNMTHPSTVVHFVYVVKPNHTASALEYLSPGSFNGSFIRYSTNPTTQANTTLPDIGEEGSISYYETIEIDTEPPYITGVGSVNPAGVYRHTNPLNISIEFSAPVVVNGSGDFTLALSSSSSVAALAEYNYGSGTNILYFFYEVTDDDGSSRLDYEDSAALTIANDYVRRLSTFPTTDADLTLSRRGTEGSLADSSYIIIDNGAPYILNSTTTLEDGLYGVNQEIYIDLFFTDDVIVEDQENFVMPLNAGSDVWAYYYSGSGTNIITFLYVVEEGDSSTDLDHDGVFSLMIANEYSSIYSKSDSSQFAAIYLAEAGTDGSLSYFSDIKVDTNQTYVVSVDSDKRNGEYGAGEDIYIKVEFSTKVTIFKGPEIYLETGDETSYAVAHYYSGNNTNTLVFLYQVQQDDEALDLDVLDTCEITTDDYPDLYLDLSLYFLTTGCPFSVAMNGTIYRKSTNPTFEVDYTLPAPTESGSLSWNKDIIINTEPPKILFVASLREGTYTSGESVDIQVIFDKPVTLNGSARLAFNLDANAFSSTQNLTEYALSTDFVLNAFPYASQTITFTYLVQIGDWDTELGYANADALEVVGEGSWIKRTSTNPTTDAMLNLDDDGAGNHLLKNALEIEMILESVAHESVADLEIVMYHEDSSCVILDAADERLAFGEPKERQNLDVDGFEFQSQLSSTEKEVFLSRSMGYDYAFADVAGVRISNYRNSLQSSTLFDSVSNRALDGDASGFFSEGSVTLTDLNDEPWWQVELLEDTEIGTIRVFGLEEENDKMEIQIVTIKATNELAGYFTVTVNIDNENQTTALIHSNAVCCINSEDSSEVPGQGVGESFQAKLQELSNVGLVQVSRSSSDSTNSFQRTWSVTFVTDTGNVPEMAIGSNDLDSYNSEIVFATIQEGSVAGVFSFEGASYALKTQLAPSYVMIFNGSDINPDMTLEESLESCIWFHYIEENTRQEIVRVRDKVVGRTVRIQMVNKGYLAMAEFEIFEYEHFPISEFRGASPIATREEFRAFQSAQSLNEAFRGTAVNGKWVLRITDRAAGNPYRKYSSSPATIANGEGRLGGWTLVITDILGQRKKYTMDAYTSVKTLPKYGNLYTNLDDDGGLISVEPGFERNLRACYGKDYTGLNGILDVSTYETCWYNYGIGPMQGLRRLGAGAESIRIRGEMALYYQPLDNYLGPDIFTYSATIGNKESTQDGYVIVHTRDCRYNITGTQHSLCECNDPLIVSHEDAQENCYNAVYDLCEGLDDDDDRFMYFRMCNSCEKTYLDNDVEEYDHFTAQCINDILKISQYLDVKGYCEESYELFQCEMTEKFGVYPTEANLHMHYEIKHDLN